MARSRNIKPGFFINDRLAEIEPLGRLLFAGLWTIADREGRLENRPKKIKAAILPYDNCDIENLLLILHNKEFIICYSAEGQDYIQITNFVKHQNPHPKEAQSIIPVAPEKPIKATKKKVASKLQVSCEPITKNADSLLPITDSLFPITSTPSNDGEEVKKYRLPFKSKRQEETFDTFYSLYPKKKSKGDAEKAWTQINPDDLLCKKIMNTLDRAIISPDWVKDGGAYVPYPATWLRAKGWEDEFSNKQTDKFQSKTKPTSYSEGLSPQAIINGVGGFYNELEDG